MRFLYLLSAITLLAFFSACTETEDVRPSPEVPEEFTFRLDGESAEYPFAYETDIIRSCRDGDCSESSPDFIRTLILTKEDVLVDGELQGRSDAIRISVSSSSREALSVFEYDFDFGFNWVPTGGVIAVGLTIDEAYDFSADTFASQRTPTDGIMIFPADISTPRRAYLDVNLVDGSDIQGTWAGSPVRISL